MSRFPKPALLRAASALAFCVPLFLAPGPASAQTYDPTMDVAKTWEPRTMGSNAVTPQEISDFMGDLPPWRTVDKFESRREQLEDPAYAKTVATDPELRNSMAVSRIWDGRSDLATGDMRDLVREFPNNPMYRRNYATALEKGPKLYEKALEEAEKAADLSAGGRGKLPYLERLRFARLNYLLNVRRDTAWGKKNHFLHNFTVGFNNRKLPPASYPKLKLDGALATEKRHLMEMLTYHPEFADGYFCLAMLEEYSNNFTGAYELYKIALDLDHPRSPEIKTHIGSMAKVLPRGYMLAGSAGAIFQNVLKGVFWGVAILLGVWATPFVWAKVSGRPRRKKRRWSPDKWQEFEEDRLRAELDSRLRGEEDFSRDGRRGGKGASRLRGAR